MKTSTVLSQVLVLVIWYTPIEEVVALGSDGLFQDANQLLVLYIYNHRTTVLYARIVTTEYHYSPATTSPIGKGNLYKSTLSRLPTSGESSIAGSTSSF